MGSGFERRFEEKKLEGSGRTVDCVSGKMKLVLLCLTIAASEGAVKWCLA